MAQTEVSSVIRDIINAFKSGSTVFRRCRGRKHKRRPSQSTLIDEDKRVHDSLAQRPEDIQSSYDQSVARHGRKFEVGDRTSQTSLAQVLLVLNTGLIKLLNQALSHDSKSRSQSRDEIFSLSESAAMDTLHALSELNTRLISASRLDLRLPKAIKDSPSYKQDPRPYSSSREVPESDRSGSHGRQRSSSSGQQAKRPSISPRLPNGGWIRSKSDPSVVSVVTPNKTTMKKSDRKRPSASRSQSYTSAQSSSIDLPSNSRKATLPVYSPSPQDIPDSLSKSKPSIEYGHSFYDQFNPLDIIPETQMRRHPSMYIVPADFFNAFPITTAMPRYEPQITERPTTPKDTTIASKPPATRDTSGGVRPRPPSMMTFKTASTKIGEIPEHKLPDRILTEEQQLELPMPYVIPEMLEQPSKKRRGFKFWKRQIGAQQALAV